MDDCMHWIVLGQVARPHGVRGALRVQWYSDPAELTGPIDQVQLHRIAGTTQAPLAAATPGQHAGAVQTFAVASLRPTTPERALLHLVGIDNPEQAGAWRGAQIRVPRALVPELGPHEIYLFELLGREIYDPDGVHLGRASQLYDFGAGPVLGVIPPPPACAAPADTSAPADATAPADAGLAFAAAAPPRPRRGRRARHARAQEQLIPLLANTLREAEPHAKTAVVAIDPSLIGHEPEQA